jgi:hypothetical protein
MNLSVALILLLTWSSAQAGPAAPCAASGAVNIPECCGSSLEQCLKKNPPCEIAARLDAYRQWLVEKERPCSSQVNDLMLRYQCLHDTVRHIMDTVGMQFVGPPDATVIVVLYVSMSCPLCKRLYAQLHDTLIGGPPGVRQTFRLGIKTYGTTRLDHALAAAAELGQQSRLLRRLADVPRRLGAAEVESVALAVGIDPAQLWRLADSEQIKARVAATRAEGTRNNVEVTPAVFINRRHYYSSKDVRWVMDAIMYERERLNGGKQ